MLQCTTVNRKSHDSLLSQVDPLDDFLSESLSKIILLRSIFIKDSILVYSTDPSRNKKCPRCGYLVLECVCSKPNQTIPDHIEVVLRLEKSVRAGKTVTVIDRLPKNETYLKDLTKMLNDEVRLRRAVHYGSR